MANNRRRGPRVEDPATRERDLQDVEREDDLRRQVRLLEERLARFEVLEHGDSRHGSELEDEENINPFHNARRRVPSEEGSLHRQPRRNNEFRRDLGIKVNIPEFEGRMQHDEFIDWLHTVERIFEYEDVPEHYKVKLVAIKLKKHASIWWEQLKVRRAREGK